MPQRVEVEGIGRVEFSDDFAPEEIERQVSKLYLEKEKAALKPGLGEKALYGLGAIGDGINWGFKKLDWAVSVLPASVADVAEGWAQDEWTPEEARGTEREPGGFRNLKAWWHGASTSYQPTWQEIAESPPAPDEFWASVGAKVSRAGADLLPRLYLMRGATKAVTLPGAGAVVFGAGEEGFTGKGAFAGAVIPQVQKLGKAASGRVLARIGGDKLPVAAQKAVEEIGGLAAIQTFNEALAVPELKQLYQDDPDQFWQQLAADTVVNAGFLVLSAPGWRRGVPSETQRFLSQQARQPTVPPRRPPSPPADVERPEIVLDPNAPLVEEAPPPSGPAPPVLTPPGGIGNVKGGVVEAPGSEIAPPVSPPPAPPAGPFGEVRPGVWGRLPVPEPKPRVITPEMPGPVQKTAEELIAEREAADRAQHAAHLAEAEAMRQAQQAALQVPVGAPPSPAPAEPAAAQRRAVQRVTARRKIDRETESYGPDIIDWLVDQGGVLGRAQARRLDRFSGNADLWDGQPEGLAAKHHDLIYETGPRGMMPDEAATAAAEAGLIKEPHVSSLWDAVDRASTARVAMGKQLAAEEAELARASKEEAARSESVNGLLFEIRFAPTPEAVGRILARPEARKIHAAASEVEQAALDRAAADTLAQLRPTSEASPAITGGGELQETATTGRLDTLAQRVHGRPYAELEDWQQTAIRTAVEARPEVQRRVEPGIPAGRERAAAREQPIPRAIARKLQAELEPPAEQRTLHNVGVDQLQPGDRVLINGLDVEVVGWEKAPGLKHTGALTVHRPADPSAWGRVQVSDFRQWPRYTARRPAGQAPPAPPVEEASPPALGGGELGGAATPTPPEADPRHSVFDAVPMELPEAVQVVKLLTGDYPRIRERLRALGGAAAGVFRHGQGEGSKGTVELRADIFDLLTPDEKAKLREQAGDYATATAGRGDDPAKIAEERYQFLLDQAYEEAKKRNPLQALKVIWHEIGHVVDWLPEHIVRGRGNIFGRLGSLKNYLKSTFPIDPAKPAGARLNPADLRKLREDAYKAMQAELGPMREIIETILVEEPIYRNIGITGDMIKRLFGMDARETMPELYKWFAEQPAEVKKEIVRAAMKGMVGAKLAELGLTEQNIAALAGSEQIGTRQVKREVRRREGREPTPAEIEAKFKELFRAEMLKRNLADLAQIKAEMEPTIAWWRGTETMPDYFKPAKEMYAEAFSVFANNPAAFSARAPTYARMLWNYLDRKPAVRALYDQIQADIKAGQIMPNRVKTLRAMFEADAQRSVALDGQRGKLTGRDFLDNVRYHFDRRFGPVYRLARGYSQEGAVREAIGSFLYRATEHERFLGNVNDRVAKPMVRQNLDWSDLGEWLFHQRVTKERFTLANPLGWTPKNALERLAEMQRQLGPARWAALEAAGKEFRALYEEHVTGPVGAARVFTPELQKILDQRVHYATFAALKGIPDTGIENILATQYGSSVTPHIYRQIGMAGEIKNPATATVLKGLSLISAALRNTVKRETVAMLRERAPEDIAPAKLRWNGKFREPVIEETPKVGTVIFLRDGQIEGYYVRRHVADALNSGNAIENLAFRTMQNATGWLKGLFTQLNYAFWPVNFVRDTMGWQMQLPGASPLAYAKVFPRALAAARASVTRRTPNPYAEAALKRRLVISQNDPRGVWAATDNEFDFQVARMGLDPAAWSREAGQVKRIVKLWQHYRELGSTVERVNKIAGMIHLDERFPDMPEWKKNEIVRERAGSPNFLERGASNPYVDMFALFYNPWKEGIRSVTKSARENPWQFGAKATVAILMPTVLQAAAVNGWLGDDLKRRYRSVTDYDLTNYLVPPPRWVNEEQKKVANLRLPLWEPARVAHGIIFQMLTGRGQGIASFAGGQLPGLNPIVGTAAAWASYAQGHNPQDTHRGAGVLTETQQQARPESWTGVEQMLKWTWNNAGGSILFRFQNPNLESPPDSTAEKFLALPVINNALGRWIKVTDRGLFDAQRDETGNAVEARRAGLRLAVDPIVDKLARGETLLASEWAVLRDPYALNYLDDKLKKVVPARQSIDVRLLQKAVGPEGKAAVLQNR